MCVVVVVETCGHSHQTRPGQVVRDIIVVTVVDVDVVVIVDVVVVTDARNADITVDSAVV